MWSEHSGTLAPVTATAPSSQSRLRLAILDRDPGFMQVLAKRL